MNHINYDNNIILAVKTGDFIEFVKLFIKNIYMPHIHNQLLETAIENKHENIIDFLIENASMSRNYNCRTLLVAMKHENVKVIKYLRQCNLDDHDYDIAIRQAVEHNQLEIIKCLLDDADSSSSGTGRERYSGAAAHTDSSSSEPTCLSNKRYQKNYMKYVLWLASNNGHLDIVKFLISKNVFDNFAISEALSGAVQTGKLEVMKCLIENGADVNNDGGFPLCTAASHNQLEAVELLIKHNVVINCNRRGPLINAALSGHIEMIKLLIDNGADINRDSENVLTNACSFGHFEIVKLLIEKGADIHVYHDFPLREAARYGYLDVVKLLIEKGADVFAYDQYPLTWSLIENHLDVAKYLLCFYVNTYEIDIAYINTKVNNFADTDAGKLVQAYTNDKEGMIEKCRIEYGFDQ